MKDSITKLNKEIKRLVEEDGLLGYSIFVAGPNEGVEMNDVTMNSVAETMLLAIKCIDSPNTKVWNPESRTYVF